MEDGGLGGEEEVADGIGRWRVFRFWLSAQEGFHPDYEFGDGEGLFEVVVAAEVEAADYVIDTGLCGQEEDWSVFVVLADGLNHVETGHLGHHDIDDEEIGVQLEVAAEAFGTVGCEGDGEVLGFQGIFDDACKGLFVLESPQNPIRNTLVGFFV